MIQEHRRSKSDVYFQRSLPKGWQILLGVSGDFNAPLLRDGHRVKNSCGVPTVNSDLLTQFIEANDLIPMNGYLRQKTNQLPTFRGPNERVTRLDWILSKNIDKSHITKINNVMPKIAQTASRYPYRRSRIR